MKPARMITAALILIIAMTGVPRAGAELTISDQASMELGFMLQTYFLANVGEQIDDRYDFDVRRARIRMGGSVTGWVNWFFQSDVFGENYTAKLVDAWIRFNIADWAMVYLGEHMPPTGRQHLTSSAALMAFARPGIVTYNLGWGFNAKNDFNTSSYPTGDLNLRTRSPVRDLGATLFGALSPTDMLHAKYYVGVYEGIHVGDNDNLRWSARTQVNLFDPEADYFNLSTYLGEKRTIALGVSVDWQEDIVSSIQGDLLDYFWVSTDLFSELPLGVGSFTGEAAFQYLQLGDGDMNIVTAPTPVNVEQTTGIGYYVQAGYFLGQIPLQPWLSFEQWIADDEADEVTDEADYFLGKAGVSFFFAGHHANVKLGYEFFKRNIDSADPEHTIALGLFVAY